MTEEEKEERLAFAKSLDKVIGEMVTGLTRMQHFHLQQGLIKYFPELAPSPPVKDEDA